MKVCVLFFFNSYTNAGVYESIGVNRRCVAFMCGIYKKDDMADEVFSMEFGGVVVQEVSAYPSGDLAMRSSDGNIQCTAAAIEMNGDMIIDSNLIVNNSVNFQDMNVFRTFDEGHTISFGMRINDQERLELYKFDSRVGKSTVVNTFGVGSVASTNTAVNETVSQNLDVLYNKGKRIVKPTRGRNANATN